MTFRTVEAQCGLRRAQRAAYALLAEVEKRKILKPGISEISASESISDLAANLFQIKRHWHEKLVRSGASTLLHAGDRLTDKVIQEDDIVFLDLGPVLEQWRADIGRTYVFGDDPVKHKLNRDIVKAFRRAKAWYLENQNATGAELYDFVRGLAHEYGWSYTAPIAGHTIGAHPDSYYARERRLPEERVLISPRNKQKLNLLRGDGADAYWILEIHFVDLQREVGGFYEDFLNV